jgi:ATPase subunit of ABC transporter with duplicated ATPase domains
MKRILDGSVAEQDFVLAEPWWDWQEQLSEAKRQTAIDLDIDLDKPISHYSGGEQFRLCWLAAMLNKPDAYVFDEPTNHLDQAGRLAFTQWINGQSKPVIVVSHDRTLLEKVDAIYELTATTLHYHPGNYSNFYQQQKERWHSQESRLENERKEQRRTAKKVQEDYEKQQQRTAHGKNKAHKENWGALERGGAKESASLSLGALTRRNASRTANTQNRVQLVEQQREWFDPIQFELLGSLVSASKRILTLQALEVCLQGVPLNPPYNIAIKGPQRILLTGLNGTGKSLLIKTIVNQWTDYCGERKIHVPHSYLDQNFYHLDQSATPVELFLNSHAEFTQQDAQERLAWLRLRNTKAMVPFGKLSGGEQLKTALAIHLLGAQSPQLLLLDEPTNHLDLDSLIALEQAMSTYQGAMIIVSHDKTFTDKLRLTHEWDVATGALSIL